MAAVRADAEDFQMVTVDREIGVPTKFPDDLIERATGEGDDRTAFRTNEMVPVSGRADDVCRVAAGLKQAREDVDRSEDFERSVNRRPTNLRHLGDKLLGRKGAVAAKDRLHDPPARRRHPIAVFKQECIDVGRLNLSGGRIHGKRVAQAFNEPSCHNQTLGSKLGLLSFPVGRWIAGSYS
jgi:hypothetical protein